MQNCQEKTYKAFNMYMKFEKAYAQEARTYDSAYISWFTGMDAEKGDDTMGTLPKRYGVHSRTD